MAIAVRASFTARALDPAPPCGQALALASMCPVRSGLAATMRASSGPSLTASVPAALFSAGGPCLTPPLLPPMAAAAPPLPDAAYPCSLRWRPGGSGLHDGSRASTDLHRLRPCAGARRRSLLPLSLCSVLRRRERRRFFAFRLACYAKWLPCLRPPLEHDFRMKNTVHNVFCVWVACAVGDGLRST